MINYLHTLPAFDALLVFIFIGSAIILTACCFLIWLILKCEEIKELKEEKARLL